jgi:hypothetical protein
MFSPKTRHTHTDNKQKEKTETVKKRFGDEIPYRSRLTMVYLHALDVYGLSEYALDVYKLSVYVLD